MWTGPDAAPQRPIADQVFEQARRGHVVVETVDSVDGTPVRHLFLPIPRQGDVRYVLQAEASLRLYRETLKGLLLLLTLGSGTILIGAWLGSGWLAKKVLVRMRFEETTHSRFTL